MNPSCCTSFQHLESSKFVSPSVSRKEAFRTKFHLATGPFQTQYQFAIQFSLPASHFCKVSCQGNSHGSLCAPSQYPRRTLATHSPLHPVHSCIYGPAQITTFHACKRQSTSPCNLYSGTSRRPPAGFCIVIVRRSTLFSMGRQQTVTTLQAFPRRITSW